MRLLPFLLFLSSFFTPAQGFLPLLSKKSPPHRLLAGDRQDDEDWSMAEDWALMDGVKAYTICTSTNKNYTFWDRIVSSNPLLRGRRSAAEARQHYFSSTLLGNTTTSIIMAGPPPLLLQDWWIRVENNHHVIGMGGRLGDGRSVWFPVASLGHFEGHVLDVYEAPPCLSAQAIPGGYCEAVGGMVYELGRPRAVGAISSVSNTNSRVEVAISRVQTTAFLAAVSLATLGYLVGMIYGQSIAAAVPAQIHYEHGPAGALTVVPSPDEIKARQKLHVMEDEWMQERIGIINDQSQRQIWKIQQLEKSERRQHPQVGWGFR